MAVGVDIHPKYQENFDWSSVDYSDDPVRGVRFVWVKVSDGGGPSTWLVGGRTLTPRAQIEGAKSRGIPVGVYHYAQFSPTPEAQADVLINEMLSRDARGVCPLLDLEAPFSADNVAKQFGIRFCNRVVARGFRPAVYMNASFARALRPDLWGIQGLVIVVARYGALPEAPGSSQYLGRYDVHQFASNGSRGHVTVDLDDSRNQTLYPGGFTVSDSSNITAIHGSVVAAKQSKVPGSTATYPTEEFVRFTNAHTYDMIVNKWPAIFDGFNQLGAQLSQIFTMFDERLAAIEEAVGVTGSAADARTQNFLDAAEKLGALQLEAGLKPAMNLSDTDETETTE